MLTLVTVACVLAYAFVASQHFFFLFALGRVSLGLSGPAYAALRQQINAVITPRIMRLYPTTALIALALAGLGLLEGRGRLALGALVSAACLVVDLVLAVKGNVPLNTIMNGWRPDALPEDWPIVRARWHDVFTVRQVVLSVGFVALVVGVSS